jgi:potassium/chloride transporter 9
LGHVIVTEEFGSAVPEARRQQQAWKKYIDFSEVKAFVNIAISPMVEWGARNIVLTAGLGGMRPNIAVLGFYNLDYFRNSQPLVDVPPPQTASSAGDSGSPLSPSKGRRRRDSKDAKLEGLLPTDTCKVEGAMSLTSYVAILEDLLLSLQINVAVAKGFKELEFPHPKGENTKKYIDLWPIQMSAEIPTEGDDKPNVLTTNFDTYTLILQLGCILNTVPAWKKVYKLRVAVFVEYDSDVDEERGRVKALLYSLRIEAEILVFCLASGNLKTYEIIVNDTSGGPDGDAGDAAAAEKEVDECLKDDEWWEELQKFRGKRGQLSSSQDLAEVGNLLASGSAWPNASFQQGHVDERVERFDALRKLLGKPKRKHTMSGLNRLGVSVGMTTHRLQPQVIHHYATNDSSSEDSSTGSDSETDVFESDSDDVGSQGKASAASENDLDDFETDDEGDPVPPTSAMITRRRSHGDSLRGPPPKKPQKELIMPRPTTSKSQVAPSWPQEATTPFQSTLIGVSQGSKPHLPLSSPPTSQLSTQLKSIPSPIAPQDPPVSEQPDTKASIKTATKRPSLERHASMPKFSSKPVPITKVATEDGPGPSIMFAEAPSPPRPYRRHRLPSAYDIPEEGPESRRGSTASGFPASGAVPLSFNDLPSRAQHLILNELMKQQSEYTAVIFTTLPSPIEGTCKDEKKCLAYLSDLEVLCKELPPTLLVHSNSMTVTVNL